MRIAGKVHVVQHIHQKEHDRARIRSVAVQILILAYWPIQEGLALLFLHRAHAVFDAAPRFSWATHVQDAILLAV